MLLVDVTIVAVALPDMAGDLHATLPDLQWVLSLYALVLAALMLTSGPLADRIGRRAVYLGGLVVFAAAAGPLIGGLLTADFGRRWIFLVNLPVCVVAVVLTVLVERESRDPSPRSAPGHDPA